jgi:hypothetical protein
VATSAVSNAVPIATYTLFRAALSNAGVLNAVRYQLSVSPRIGKRVVTSTLNENRTTMTIGKYRNMIVRAARP